MENTNEFSKEYKIINAVKCNGKYIDVDTLRSKIIATGAVALAAIAIILVQYIL